MEKKAETTTEVNPFFTEWNTPMGTAPFSKIKNEHYMPAFKKALAELADEVKAIAENKEAPTFENTIAALDKRGPLLRKVSGVFYNLKSADTNDEINNIAKEVSPLMSKSEDDIWMNDALWKRVKALYEKKDDLGLNQEQANLLDKTYKGFVRSGANLGEDDKAKLRKVNEELSLNFLKFGENVLTETNAFQMFIDKKEDLAGLPESVVIGAAEAAKEAGQEGKWLFTTQKPSMIPFLQYAENRDLRKKLYDAYLNRGNNGNANDNKEVIKKIVALNIQKANLLGFETPADYLLDNRMSKKPENVFALLDKLWKPALDVAKQERKEMQQIINEEGGKFKLAAHDWWYYAEKLKVKKYNLDENMLRPYFKLENVVDGAFKVAEKLYGLKFIPRTDIEPYHKEVKVYELQEANGKHIGIFYVDYFPRASKRGGAWMNSYRKQWKPDGKEVTPIICNVCNFSKPVGDKPALLSFDEVSTLFHEFGHALHGFLSNTSYYTTSGTSVARDFVELPSQIMENWAADEQVLKMFAKHYETGEVIPDELIQKLKNAGHFNQGFATTEYLAASLLDMKYHTLKSAEGLDVEKFENETLKAYGLIPEIYSRYKSTYFQHIFTGGYSAGYYSYIWAEVLDADAFDAFKEKGIFNKELATSFRENVLSKGGTEDPMVLYKKFRGQEPSIDPLLAKRGLN
ncbi:M3 family peptidase [Puteibacter caeruleilacunae]|nr:M3 family peptidase [Puteibacter caeruleilacunae]